MLWHEVSMEMIMEIVWNDEIGKFRVTFYDHNPYHPMPEAGSIDATLSELIGILTPKNS